MAGKIFYNPELILFLDQMVVKKFKEDYLTREGEQFPIGNDSKLYGSGAYEYPPQQPDWESGNFEPSIGQVIIEQEASRLPPSDEPIEAPLSQEDEIKRQQTAEWKIRHYLARKINSKYLFQKRNEAKESKGEKITFGTDYMDIFLRYLGLKDVQALQEAQKKANIAYVGFYLSFYEWRVKTISIEISTVSDADGNYAATLRGIHSRDGYVDNEVYNGSGYYEGPWLYLNMKGFKYKRRLNIIAAVDEQEEATDTEKKKPYIRAQIQGTTLTKGNRLFSWEVFLVRTTKEKLEEHKTVEKEELSRGPVKPTILHDNHFRIISLYLVLHRNVFALRSEGVDDLNKLIAKGNNVNLYAEKLNGVFRIWNFNSSMTHIIQSRIEFTNDGTGTFFTHFPIIKDVEENSIFAEDQTIDKKSIEDKKQIREHLISQAALLNTSKIYPNLNKVIIATFADGINLVNTAMFDIKLGKDDNLFKEVLVGAFNTLAYEKHGALSGLFVMQKVSLQGGNAEEMAPVKEWSLEDAYLYAKEKGLTNLLKQFWLLHEQSHWKTYEKEKSNLNSMLDRVKKEF